MNLTALITKDTEDWKTEFVEIELLVKSPSKSKIPTDVEFAIHKFLKENPEVIPPRKFSYSTLMDYIPRTKNMGGAKKVVDGKHTCYVQLKEIIS